METILCPTDFSPASQNVLHYAAQLSRQVSARLVLFHNIYEPADTVFVTTGGASYAEPIRDFDYRQALQQKLNNLKAKLERENGDIGTDYEIRLAYGLSKETIPQVAEEIHADMIIMGKEQVKGLEKILIDSVTEAVIKQASCPVLIIPHKTHFKPPQKVVFATDLQGEPFTDVSYVLQLTAQFEAEILFLHILPNDLPPTHDRAQANLEQLQKRLSYDKVSFHTEVNPDIAVGISRFTRRHKGDMLVMAYHPQSFWQQLFSREHTQEMTYHSRLPLLVLHYRN